MDCSVVKDFGPNKFGDDEIAVGIVVQGKVRQPKPVGGNMNKSDPVVLLWIPNQPLIQPLMQKPKL